MNYVYIDESGNEKGEGKYLIFASISTQDPRTLEKAMKKLWKSKPQFHILGELHAKEVDDSTRKRVLLRLAELPITVRHMVLNKQKRKSSASSSYYAVLAEFLAEHSNMAAITIVDKKDTNKRRSHLIRELGLQKVFKKVRFDESHKVKQLQAVDFVAWSLGRFYEHNDSSYYDLIRNKESPSL